MNSQTLSWTALPAPSPRLFAAICRVAYERRYGAFLAAASPVECARMRSAAGHGAGLWITANPDNKELTLTNEQFARAFRLRIGIPQFLPGALCQLKRIKDPETCFHPLDAYGAHALSCRCGHAVLRVHGAILDIIADACRTAGMWTRKEVVVPAWAEWSLNEDGIWQCKEAILDVTAIDIAKGTHYLIDATVRNPLASRYLEGNRSSATVSGFACNEAVQQKQQ